MSGAASDSDGSSYVTLTLSPDPGFKLRFDGLTATEELGRPFLIEIDASSGDAKGNIGAMLGASATVAMTSAAGTKTYFNGILARAAYAGLGGGVYRYHFELRPWIWLLTRTSDCKIFQNMPAWDIINKVFKDHGFNALDKRQNAAGDIVLEYCVQYRESAFDFVTRLMENVGLYYYFDHKDGSHDLLLADDPNSHTALGAAIPFYFSQTEVRAVQDHVWEWTADLQLQPGVYTFRDYNFTTPAADLTAKSLHSATHPYSSFEVYDYPGVYDTAADGRKLSDVRIQELTSRVQLFDGKSNARGIRSGVKFKLSEAADTALNQEYLVLRAITAISIAEGASDSRGNLVDSHRVEFTAIPGTVPFRLEQRTPRPMIRGPQTAKVVGESGEEITTDQYGRIKVQFYWDRVGTNDQNSSCWIRVAQNWAGAGWGGMVIPRIGMEVVVEFLEGNPDRPLVTGVVYNATQTVPYPLPGKKVISTFKTNSSKGGGGFNELRFDDTKGTEEIFFHAQYDYNKVVLHNETVKITQDTTTTVLQGNRKVTVDTGNDTHLVSTGNREVTVAKGNDTHTVNMGNRTAKVDMGDDSTTVSLGNQSIKVSVGTQTIDVTIGSIKASAGMNIEQTAKMSIKQTANMSIELSCGPSSIKLDPTGITISGPKISVSAQAMMSLDGGGVMTQSAGIIKIN